MTEADLSKAICDLAHKLGWQVFRLSVNRTVRPVKDAVGYPDLTLARRQHVLFMELKTDKGVVSDDQWRWGTALPEWYVIRPADWESGRVMDLLAWDLFA
jgi:hypothetical protein